MVFRRISDVSPDFLGALDGLQLFVVDGSRSMICGHTHLVSEPASTTTTTVLAQVRG